MTGLNHAATGALVAVAVKQPALALPLAFLAHFAVDAVPHWNYGVRGRLRRVIMSIDLLGSASLLVVLALILTTPAWLVIACGFLCILPDAFWLPEILYGKPPVIHKYTLIGSVREFHRKIQWSETSRGLIFEVLWFGGVLALILLVGH